MSVHVSTTFYPQVPVMFETHLLHFALDERHLLFSSADFPFYVCIHSHPIRCEPFVCPCVSPLDHQIGAPPTWLHSIYVLLHQGCRFHTLVLLITQWINLTSPPLQSSGTWQECVQWWVMSEMYKQSRKLEFPWVPLVPVFGGWLQPGCKPQSQPWVWSGLVRVGWLLGGHGLWDLLYTV